MKLKYEFIIRELGDRYVAVAVGENAEEFSALVKMNKSGKIMMEMLKEDTTEDKMVAQLMEKYEEPKSSSVSRCRSLWTEFAIPVH